MPKKKYIIQVIGIGVVGKAFSETLESLGHFVYRKDKLTEEFTDLADFYFICTHEKDVLEVIQNYFPLVFEKPIIIRSTMTPKQFKEIKAKSPYLHLSCNPEFLRQRFAKEDSLNPEFIIIGECCKFHGNLLENLFKPLKCTIFKTTPENALMIKLAHNAFLSTLISFWNEITKICKKPLDPFIVARSCTLSSRIPLYGTNIIGAPFSGSCLPKDLDHLIQFAKENGVNPIILKAVRKVNKEFEKKE